MPNFIDAAVLAAIIGGVFALVNQGVDYLINRRRQNADIKKVLAEAGNIDASTIEHLRMTVNELVKRVDELESKNEEKEEALETLRQENAELKSIVDELKGEYSNLLKWLKDNNLTGYPEPRNGLLDTNPKMKTVPKKVGRKR